MMIQFPIFNASPMLLRLVMLFGVVGLGGCGYASSPGIVVETKQYPLGDETTLIVTRHLDYWKTGSLFKFEWYVVKCRRKTGPESLLLESMVVRGTFSNEIPKERIQISDGKVGYAYFNEIVAFDKSCNKISYFDPWRNHAIHPETMRSGYRIQSANIEPSGRGYIRLLWAAKKAGEYEGYPPSYKEPLNSGLEFKTNDFGVHWTLPNSDMDVVKEVKVEPPAAANISTFGEITDKLEKSNYVVVRDELTRREHGVASTLTSLSHDEEFRVLKKGLELATKTAIVRDGARVIIVDFKEHYEIIIANPSTLSSQDSRYVYASKVLVNKKANVLAQWLAGKP